MRYVIEIGEETIEGYENPVKVLADYQGEQMGDAYHAANGIHEIDSSLPIDRLRWYNGALIAAPAHCCKDWCDKEKFLNALLALVTPDAMGAAMQSPDAMIDLLSGVAMLTTEKAPDGVLNLNDSMVAPWLENFGLTTDQVRAKMCEMEGGNV